MLALRTQRPFSLDGKLPDLDRYLPAGLSPVEVRLLAVEPEFRKTAVFAALLDHGVRHALSEGYDLGVISGTTRQLKLYRHLGAVPFGPLVGSADAPYQPMYITLEAFRESADRSAALRETFAPRLDAPNELNFLPGPVNPAPEVRAAFHAPPISHRSSEFMGRMAQVRTRLCRLTGAHDVQVLVGSGSLANEVVAAQLSLHATPGLVLSNGEFGERLVNNARRARLDSETLRLAWGECFDLERVRAALDRLPRGGWLWFVHHETSTGILNPLEAFVALCAPRGVRVCIDCVSSLGALPVDLRGVHLASSTSGKGLGGYPGLSFVFHDYEPRSEPERLAGYLDLGHWAEHASVPHTHSSNLLFALAAAVHRVTPDRMERIRATADWLRSELRNRGFALTAPEAVACPAIVTLVPPAGLSAFELGEALDLRGFWLSYRSAYLVERNWLQIALLGDPPRAGLEKLLRVLQQLSERKLARAAATTAR